MSVPGRRYGYRPKPRLSANQIAEYLGASAPRRKSIIREAQFPKTSIVARYDKAREGLVNFLVDGSRSLNHLARVTEFLTRRYSRPDASEWVRRDSQYSIEAIEAFQRGYNQFGLLKIGCRSVHGRQPPLIFRGTKISVTLDAMTRKPSGKGYDQIGGVIMVFSRGEKSSRKRIDRCKTIAGLIYTFCGKHLKTRGEADRSICYAVDLFGLKSYTPPGAFVRKLKQIEESCEEIADRWETIEPPPDYDGPDPG